MDTPRRWQVASLATAVASISISGLMISRPTSEAVSPIDLDDVVENRELSITSAAEPSADRIVDRRIVSAEEAPPPLPRPSDPDGQASTTSPTSPDEDATVSTSQESATIPAPAQIPDSAPADSPASVDSSASVDSDD